MVKRTRQRFQEPKYRPTFTRYWREAQNLTLVELAEKVGTTHATLSRLERGVTPYDQILLEALAKAFRTDVTSLLTRKPDDPEGIWSVWDQAQAGERQQIIAIAKALLKTRNDQP